MAHCKNLHHRLVEIRCSAPAGGAAGQVLLSVEGGAEYAAFTLPYAYFYSADIDEEPDGTWVITFSNGTTAPARKRSRDLERRIWE